jgi:hypothetical protein
MDLKSAWALLDQCVDKLLVMRDRMTVYTGTVYPNIETVYEIAPGMKTAVDELLYPPE